MYAARASAATSGTLYEIPTGARFPETTDGAAGLTAWVAANTGYEAIMNGAVHRSVGVVLGLIAWFDTSDNSVDYSGPAPTTSEITETRKNEGVALARWQWDSIPIIDQSKAGEGNPRARATTLYVVQNCLLASNTTLLSDAAKWAEIKAMLEVNARTFHRVHHLRTEDPAAGWTDSILSNRYAYKLASTPGDTRNSIAPQRVDLLGAQALPSNWMSESELNDTIESVVAFLDGH